VVSVAKRDLRAGEVLDGEGGYTVRGVLAPASASLARHALPIGLAGGVTLRNDIVTGDVLTYEDVSIDEGAAAVRLRRRLESAALAQSRP
jgi:predicted homoserine dehydrogenase-like protein